MKNVHVEASLRERLELLAEELMQEVAKGRGSVSDDHMGRCEDGESAAGQRSSGRSAHLVVLVGHDGREDGRERRKRKRRRERV